MSFLLKKKFDVDKISTTVDNIQASNPYRYWSKNIQVIPASLVSSIIQNEQNRQQAEKERLDLIEKQYNKEEQIRRFKRFYHPKN
ncbi:hypothetical protein [Pectobacterium polonicum]|uniref:hypothetical protein n=1 Tax=Pectobacterium polonicum TaxID=2485124 RepID=UPI002B2527C2|nr:hypothetical protein [Pectobacterium polonicum]